MHARKTAGEKPGMFSSIAELFGSSHKRIKVEAPHFTPAPEALSMFLETPQKGDRVLIVDDDKVIQQALGAALRRGGYCVSVASDCSEAISMVADLRPDFILLDLSFPPDIGAGGIAAWDGLQLLHWLKGLQNVQKARFIIISASDSPELKRRAQEMGAMGFLTKPLD